MTQDENPHNGLAGKWLKNSIIGLFVGLTVLGAAGCGQTNVEAPRQEKTQELVLDNTVSTASVSNLPANSEWGKDKAPVERLAALEEKIDALRNEVFSAMHKDTISPQEIAVVMGKIGGIQNDIKGSTPRLSPEHSEWKSTTEGYIENSLKNAGRLEATVRKSLEKPGSSVNEKTGILGLGQSMDKAAGSAFDGMKGAVTELKAKAEIVNQYGFEVIPLWKESNYSEHGIAGVYNPATKQVEWRESQYSEHGIAGVYNPATKQVEWRESQYSEHGVVGVHNPATGKVEWKESTYSEHGIDGVYNPATKQVEWRESQYSEHDVAGVYNPSTGKTEWRESRYSEHSIAGVYNPAAKQVEWKESDYSEHDIAGVYNRATGKVEWKESSYSEHSIAGVSADPENPTLSSSSSNFCDFDDD
ncbi:MAG: hypothetical protein AB2L14_34845 [Candidatus Xenobiia bacterium LiM19]